MRSAVSAAAREWVIRIPAPAFALIWVAQQSERLRCGARIQVSGRLIREHQPRPVHQRAGDRDPLHFAARQLARKAMGQRCDSDRLEHVRGSPSAIRLGHAQQVEGQGDVLFHGEIRQDVKCLKHESHRAAAQESDRVVVHARQIGALQPYAAAVRTIQARQQIQQRRFADARFAHDGEVFAAPQFELQAFENRRAGRAQSACSDSRAVRRRARPP